MSTVFFCTCSRTVSACLGTVHWLSAHFLRVTLISSSSRCPVLCPEPVFLPTSYVHHRFSLAGPLSATHLHANARPANRATREGCKERRNRQQAGVVPVAHGSSSTHADSGTAPSAAGSLGCDAYRCGPSKLISGSAREYLRYQARVCPNRSGQSSTHIRYPLRRASTWTTSCCATTTQKARLIAPVYLPYLCSSTTIRLPLHILRLTNDEQPTLDLFDCSLTLCSDTPLLRASVLLKYPLLLPRRGPCLWQQPHTLRL